MVMEAPKDVPALQVSIALTGSAWRHLLAKMISDGEPVVARLAISSFDPGVGPQVELVLQATCPEVADALLDGGSEVMLREPDVRSGLGPAPGSGGDARWGSLDTNGGVIADSAGTDEDTRTRLSKREAEVLRLLGEGADNRQLSAALCISHNTVKTHVKHIMRKLHTTNRTQMALVGRQLAQKSQL